MNRRKKEGYASKFKGVVKHGRKWRARIQINGKRTHLGSFVNEVDAAIAYNEAAKCLFGEFASLNQV